MYLSNILLIGRVDVRQVAWTGDQLLLQVAVKLHTLQVFNLPHAKQHGFLLSFILGGPSIVCAGPIQDLSIFNAASADKRNLHNILSISRLQYHAWVCFISRTACISPEEPRMLATPGACIEGPPYIKNIEGSRESIGWSRHMPSDQTYVEWVSVSPKNTFGLSREQACNFPHTQEHEARASFFTSTTRRLALVRCISALVSIVSQILQGLHCDCVSVERRHRFHVHEHPIAHR